MNGKIEKIQDGFDLTRIDDDGDIYFTVSRIGFSLNLNAPFIQLFKERYYLSDNEVSSFSLELQKSEALTISKSLKIQIKDLKKT